MAKAAKKSTPRKRRAKKVEPTPTMLSMRVVLEETEDVSLFYANYAEVTHSAHEFAIFGVQVPAKLSEEQNSRVKESGVLSLPAEFQIIVPPTMIPGLIEALQGQLKVYATTASEHLSKLKGEDDVK